MAILYYHVRPKQQPAPFPPGPKGMPIVGNAADLPQSQPWLTFSEWAKQYGPIVHLRVLGQSIIVLNDVNYAAEMLDKKSRIYSNRPNLVMGGELVGWDQGPALIQFGKKWSDYRRLMAQFLGTRSKIDTSYGHILETATQDFLHTVLRRPNLWVDHARRFAGAIVLKIAYGYKAQDQDDPLVRLVDDAMEQFSQMTVPNAYAVDTFPFLRYVPQWFPGGAWKKKAAHNRDTLQTMLNKPYEWAKSQMSMGLSTSCFVSDLLDSSNPTPDEEQIIKWAAAGIYSGVPCLFHPSGMIEAFFLAMTLQPDAQRKAQSELDTVLGHCTAPQLADRPRLPFVEALISEVFRTYTIGPVGLPHVASEDDVHNGFFIPKGAIILTNNWLFYRDNKIYVDPENFSPERFLERPGFVKAKDPRDILFGYGRRACPGVHLADTSMWMLFASILAFFDISAPTRDGSSLVPSGRFLDGTISRPEQFECVVTPRKGAEDIISRDS
ncbi:cytochrome P450 [Mycena sp. CBHHK59/15]|nr:cytochrome P450 [Mycena sp. CBHHK59/15]